MTRRPGGDQVVPRPANWSPGPPPPWPPGFAPGLDLLVSVAREHRELSPAFPGARPSAVLVALAPGEHGPEVLLTRRSRELRNHRGEISFPGGRMDPGETPIVTALREAHEEVGLDPGLPEVVGELGHVDTWVSRSYIVPVVAALPAPVAVAPASPEADKAWWLPVAELTRSDTYRSESWGAAPTDRVLHFFELDDETVWGATGRMLVDLLAAAARHAEG